MNPMRLLEIFLLVLFSSFVACQQRGAPVAIPTHSQRRGSHSHMEKHHNHHKPQGGTREPILQDKNLLHDREHFKEELPAHISEKDVDDMPLEELEFQFFKTHDTNSDKRLDGLELMATLSHVIHHETAFPEPERDNNNESEQLRIAYYHNTEVKKLEELVDQILRDSDLNEDGFITYPEYIRGRRK